MARENMEKSEGGGPARRPCGRRRPRLSRKAPAGPAGHLHGLHDDQRRRGHSSDQVPAGSQRPCCQRGPAADERHGAAPVPQRDLQELRRHHQDPADGGGVERGDDRSRELRPHRLLPGQAERSGGHPAEDQLPHRPALARETVVHAGDPRRLQGHPDRDGPARRGQAGQPERERHVPQDALVLPRGFGRAIEISPSRTGGGTG